MKIVSSDDGDVGGLEPLGSLLDVELDPLCLFKVAEAAALNRREVDEDVCALIVGSDEAEALFAVEPLHSSLRHTFSSLIFIWMSDGHPQIG